MTSNLKSNYCNAVEECYTEDNQIDIFNEEVKHIFEARLSNTLGAGNIYKISDLISKTLSEIICIPNLGKKSLMSIRHFLNIHNLYLKNDSRKIIIREYGDNSEEFLKKIGIPTFKHNSILGNQQKTLLDEFAMAALTGLLAYPGAILQKKISKLSYDYAEEMIEEKVKRESKTEKSND